MSPASTIGSAHSGNATRAPPGQSHLGLGKMTSAEFRYSDKKTPSRHIGIPTLLLLIVIVTTLPRPSRDDLMMRGRLGRISGGRVVVVGRVSGGSSQ